MDTNILKILSIDHPYHCCDGNYHSNEANENWLTMTDFLDTFADADINLNLIFRFDVTAYDKGDTNFGKYYAEVFIMQQRKGIFNPHFIEVINNEEAEEFLKLLEKHWQKLISLWSPVSNTK